MDPPTVCCPTMDCPARGPRGQGHLGVHSRKDRRFMGTQGHKTFAGTSGTVFSRVRTAAEWVVTVVTWRAHGCPWPALVAACGRDERTVADGWARAGQQGHAIQASVVEPPRDLGHVHADAMRVKAQGAMGWMALARRVRTRLWRAGEVRAPRDLALMRRRMGRVRRGAAHDPRLVGTDGWCSDRRAMREIVRDPVQTGGPGRPRVRPWRTLCLAPVVPRDTHRRVVDVERRIVVGTPTRVAWLRYHSHGPGGSNTAAMERLKATCRARLAVLTRRGRARARRSWTRPHGRYRIGTGDHCWTPHASLGCAGRATTPAMATGMTEHGWRVRAVWSSHVPSPRWAPPTHRGRPSDALKRLSARGCGNHG